MTNHDHLIKEWVKKAQGYLPRKLSVRKNMQDEFHIISYTDKEWSVFYADLRQLAGDLGIFEEMYPDEKAPEFDISFPQPIPAQPAPRPFPQIEYTEDTDTWYLIVLGTPVTISSATAGNLLNAGIPFKP